ncbi:MAG: hypothetical protein ACD_10C00653G0002 [uncultured bacterium]|nr:MAG: hypothetical protein ACD_10C00653G0002 [uncultured bacterium]
MQPKKVWAKLKWVMLSFQFSEDTFGDRFDLKQLPLPRPPAGYAVQLLDTDQLLDRLSGDFLAVRNVKLSGLFATFDQAYAAARQWVETHCKTPDEHRLAIVPASFDDKLQRHVLIYGVLCGQP